MRQSGEEKLVCYHEDSVCSHPIYIWAMDANFSRSAISDITDQKAPTAIASLHQVFEDMYQDSMQTINIKSDSSTSQYRSRCMVRLLQSYCRKRLI